MTHKLAAQIETTLYVFAQGLGKRLQDRAERGQTTAEYVGIVAFVAVLVVALFSLNDTLKSKVSDIISAAFDKIKDAMG